MVQKFKSIKGEQTAELLARNENGVILRFEDGEERIVAENTLKRWWKPIPEDGDEAETPVELFEKDKDFDSLHSNLIAFMNKMEEEMGITIFKSDKVKGFYSLKKDGKMYMVIILSGLQGATLWLRSKAIEGICEYRKMKHMFDARVTISEWNLSSYDLVVKRHNLSLNYQATKASKSTTK